MRSKLTRLVALAALAMSAILPAHADAGVDGGRTANRAGSMGASGDAAVGRAAFGARLAVGATIPGIDVSHWQGTIDWTKVAAAGKRFVFMKATDDTNYIDPTFATNRAEARDNGMSVGAYHFARPDASPGDARREARFFVEVARPRPGNLLPVLDIETNDGLDQAGITKWARAWVDEVRQLTGVTPLVYTSPYGWLTRTGDTRLLSRDGAPLWVAHWGVESPTVPAGNWDGRGWIVWQHSSTGRVPGISGNVDLDVAAGTSLGRITIRQLSIVVDGGAGRVVSQPARFRCASSCTHTTDPLANVTLTAIPDDGAYFTGWTGACSGIESTCTVEMRFNRSVGAGFVTDVTPPTVAFTSPRHFTDATVVRFDEPVRNVSRENVALRQQGGPRVASTQVCRSGNGTKVPCDASLVRTVALKPDAALVPARDYVAVVNSPGAGRRVADRVGNAAATALHRFEAARTADQTQAPVIKRARRDWTRVDDPAASRGAYVVSDRPGSTVRLSFDGTGVDWVTSTGPNRGRARIYVGGAWVRTVDLFARRRTLGVVHRFDHLSEGTHTIKIVVTGRGRPAARGAVVAIDRFDVLP
jgi:GH25 family lysozyme M1 (1,4-beta-N-acetylmuramidase)